VGKIISQSPGSGQKVKEGSSVNVVVSLGPQPVKVTVPSVITMSKNDAENAILARGLVPFVTELSNPDPATHGFAYDQDPVSGTQVDVGSTVIIYVGKA